MIILIIAGAIISVSIGVYFYVITHPHIIVGGIQKKLYKGKPINSFEPFGEPGRHVKEDDSLYLTEIKYGEDYKNSYLDITYPTEDTLIDRPTVIYFHGGGYFGGDKSMGDPMAVNDDANRLFEEIVHNGYNFVNVNYALVPEYHFPVPLIQMNQAIDFLIKHRKEYGLNMKNVIIFGQSAGAVMTAQYGALISNEEYRKEMNLIPSITTKEVKALIIDDAPFITDKFNFATRMLASNYLDDNNIKGEKAKKYNVCLYVSEGFPPSFMTAGNTDGFPMDMQKLSDMLTACGVENEYYFKDRSFGDLPHGYLGLVKENKYARECFDHIVSFMNKYANRQLSVPDV